MNDCVLPLKVLLVKECEVHQKYHFYPTIGFNLFILLQCLVREAYIFFCEIKRWRLLAFWGCFLRAWQNVEFVQHFHSHLGTLTVNVSRWSSARHMMSKNSMPSRCIIIWNGHQYLEILCVFFHRWQRCFQINKEHQINDKFILTGGKLFKWNNKSCIFLKLAFLFLYIPTNGKITTTVFFAINISSQKNLLFSPAPNMAF